jgi:uncharacterized protein (DUF58 family)
MRTKPQRRPRFGVALVAATSLAFALSGVGTSAGATVPAALSPRALRPRKNSNVRPRHGE